MNSTDETSRLKILLDIPALINSSLEFGAIRKSTIEAAAKLVDAETASLLFLDDKTGELYFDVILVKGEPIKNARIAKGQGIAGWVAEHLEPLIINDVQSDPRFFKDLDKKSKFVSRTMICIPLKFKEKLVGVLEVVNKKGGDFNAEDLELLTVLGNQVAVAIENARLYAALQELTAATQEENRELKSYLSSRHTFQNTITVSPKMREALTLAEKVAKKPFATVAIFGENGTGKEVLARAVHAGSGLLENKFVAVNCAAIPQSL
ncbi:MAG: GAF domain-containing protein, partial [Nitrospirota bacterium]|nr:GAF domain-containing protein [Nitrospirota bacterium]